MGNILRFHLDRVGSLLWNGDASSSLRAIVVLVVVDKGEVHVMIL
jgi:hypothetical protein